MFTIMSQVQVYKEHSLLNGKILKQHLRIPWRFIKTKTLAPNTEDMTWYVPEKDPKNLRCKGAGTVTHSRAALWGTHQDLEGDEFFLVTPCAAQVFALGMQPASWALYRPENEEKPRSCVGHPLLIFISLKNVTIKTTAHMACTMI